MEVEKQEYAEQVEAVTPKHSLPLNMARAFLVGGSICTVGQFIMNLFIRTGMEKEEAGIWTLLCLVGASALLTGLNLYQKLVKFGGAGALVPITGFANSVAASALEYKVEGQVFGIGCKIFTIAGPVILYGILTSWGLGVLYLAGMFLGLI